MTLACISLVNTRVLSHTPFSLTRANNVGTLVLPTGISGQAYDYTRLSEVVDSWLPSTLQPPWQSHRKHNEAIRFGERSL